MPDHDHDQTARDREVLENWWKDACESEAQPGVDASELIQILTLATEALDLREEVGRAQEQIKVLTRGFNAAHEMQDEAIATLRQENARLTRELEQAREDAECAALIDASAAEGGESISMEDFMQEEQDAQVGRLLREMPRSWTLYWCGGRWEISIKAQGLKIFNGWDIESLVKESRDILDRDSYWSEIVETRDANPGGEEGGNE